MEAHFSHSYEIVDSITTTIVFTFPQAFSRMLSSFTQSIRNKFEMIKRIQEDPLVRGLPNAIDNDELLIREWKVLHHVLGRHRAGYTNFTRWLRSSKIANSSGEKDALGLLQDELEDVLGDGYRLEGEMRERIQVHVAALSLEESRKGIHQAVSVGRLTQLASVFIPLSFTTGVFGMNLESLMKGAPLWQFWVTAITISLGAFVLMAVIHRIEHRIHFWRHIAREQNISVFVYVMRVFLFRITGRIMF